MNSPASMVDEVADFVMEPFDGPASFQSLPNPSILVSNNDGIPGLRPKEDEPIEGPDLNWDAVHAAIQDALEVLKNHVVRDIPDASWNAGRSQARSFSLFSYRTFFHLDGDDFDPIVVGVTCIEEGSRVRIHGDISGDETGHIYFEDNRSHSSEGRTEAVSSEASKVAELLAAQYQLIVRVIRDRRAGAVPR